MYLYCRCGFPLLVTAAWDGQDYYLVLRDGMQGRASAPINHCPQCGYGLALEALKDRPPTVLPSYPWRNEPAETANSDTERSAGESST